MKYLSKLAQSGETTINLPNLVCTKIGEGSIKPYSFPKKTIDNDLDIKILSGGTVLTENEPLSFTAYNNVFTLSFYDYETDEEIEGIIDSFGLHFQYSYDKEEWFDWDSETRNITIENGSTVYLKGDNPNGINSEDKWIYFHFEENEVGNGGIIECHGNIMSLLGKYEKDIPCEYCFASMFYQCTSLTTTPELPATSLSDRCYNGMFYGCTSLTTAPKLPATTLTVHCYYAMFQGCSSLTTAPELPATTLADSCYDSMFEGCTSLVTAPELPATTLAEKCYYAMFGGCTSLTTAPKLPATTLTVHCYYAMFQGCSSLTTAPELPATTLADSCYDSMFEGCTSLVTAPELPATTLAEKCYYAMFGGCTSLTTAPELLATTLTESCYAYMFEGCTSLVTAPELPATALTDSCYAWMFEGCTSLVTAPELLATTLTDSCYHGMFFICTSLSSVTCLSESGINVNNSTSNWLKNVSTNGVFTKTANATWPSGANGIPNGWTINNA